MSERNSLNLFRIGTSEQEIKGFTLIELLVAIVVAGFALSGLLTLVINLLQSQQKESSQSQTQQQMQMALSYISEELREAVYVYDGNCLQAQGQPAPNFCPGLANFIPNPANSVPILAFWKLVPFPQVVQNQCTSANPPAGLSCTAGRSYTLVVYFLQSNLGTTTASITRYTLNQFISTGLKAGQQTPEYVDPSQQGINFLIWPYGQQNGKLTNLQTQQPQNIPDTLVDSVDNTSQNPNCPNPGNLVPPPYMQSPLNGVTGFYACVRSLNGQFGVNQDVLLFLRGNASGTPKIDRYSRPTLQTDVIIRGILNKTPS